MLIKILIFSISDRNFQQVQTHLVHLLSYFILNQTKWIISFGILVFVSSQQLIGCWRSADSSQVLQIKELWEKQLLFCFVRLFGHFLFGHDTAWGAQLESARCVQGRRLPLGQTSVFINRREWEEEREWIYFGKGEDFRPLSQSEEDSLSGFDIIIIS